MKSRSIFVTLVIVFAHQLFAKYPTGSVHKNITRIAFGSCNKMEYPQPLWAQIDRYNPDLWIWLGDIVYTDIKRFVVFWSPAPIESVQNQYRSQYNRPEYKLLHEKTDVIGVWDDHDYGLNNGDRGFQNKNEVKKILLEFLEEPHDSLRRNREGVFDAYTFGAGERSVKVILLDVRWFKDLSSGDLLGDEQWSWLEEELLLNQTTFTVIGSGVQVIPDDRPRLEGFHSVNKQRLVHLLKKTNRTGVVFISGDVHFGEIMIDDCPTNPYPLHEITSSGLTHSCMSIFKPIFCMPLMWLLPRTYQEGDRYVYMNFGLLDFDWDSKPPALTMRVMDEFGETKVSTTVTLDQLKPNTGFRYGPPQRCRGSNDLYLWWYGRATAIITVFGAVSISTMVVLGRITIDVVNALSVLIFGQKSSIKAKSQARTATKEFCSSEVYLLQFCFHDFSSG